MPQDEPIPFFSNQNENPDNTNVSPTISDRFTSRKKLSKEKSRNFLIGTAVVGVIGAASLWYYLSVPKRSHR